MLTSVVNLAVSLYYYNMKFIIHILAFGFIGGSSSSAVYTDLRYWVVSCGYLVDYDYWAKHGGNSGHPTKFVTKINPVKISHNNQIS